MEHNPIQKGFNMKKRFTFVFQKTAWTLWVLALLALTLSARAATHVVQFGGTFGLTYSPNSLNVSLGDTVQWQGDFSMHPLSSTSVPAGAANFHQASGSIFMYPVTVAGTYLYQCDFHFSAGMTGSFTAFQTTGIENDRNTFRPDAFRLGQNFPNPFNPTTTISFDIPYQTYVSIKVFNLVGQEVATIVNGTMKAGSYTKIWDASSVSSGVYFYRMQTGSFTDIRKLVLLK
jgi:plastocyanin